MSDTGQPVPASSLPTQPLPVTVVVSRRPAPGRTQELVDWANGISNAAAAFHGHLGAQIYPPSPPERDDLVIAFSFATADDLHTWEHSDERRAWVERGRPLIVGRQEAHGVSGFEGIFSPVVHASATPPPRWKTATVIALALYPASLLVSWLLVPHLMGINIALRVLVTTAILVPFMAWVGVPWVTRWLSGWLRPAPPAAAEAAPPGS